MACAMRRPERSPGLRTPRCFSPKGKHHFGRTDLPALHRTDRVFLHCPALPGTIGWSQASLPLAATLPAPPLPPARSHKPLRRNLFRRAEAKSGNILRNTKIPTTACTSRLTRATCRGTFATAESSFRALQPESSLRHTAPRNHQDYPGNTDPLRTQKSTTGPHRSAITARN